MSSRGSAVAVATGRRSEVDCRINECAGVDPRKTKSTSAVDRDTMHEDAHRRMNRDVAENEDLYEAFAATPEDDEE